MGRFLSDFIGDMANSFARGDYGEFTLYLFISLLVLGSISVILWFIFDRTYYKRTYSEVKQDIGELTDMKYTAAYTTSSYNPSTKMTSTTYHPAVHRVYFVGEKTGKWNKNSEYYYQRFRIGDKVTIFYKEQFKSPRFSSEQVKPEFECYCFEKMERRETDSNIA